jgi:hypothetical protein
MKACIVALTLTLVGAFSVSAKAQSSFTITLEQEGNDVVATGSGTMDLTGITYTGTDNVASFIDASAAVIGTGPTVPADDTYIGLSGPISFGSGGSIFASTDSGDSVAINASVREFFVPFGYVSNSELSSSATWDDTNLTDLDVTPGSYVWTWGTNNENSFTLDVVAVPEPSTWALMLAGMCLLGFFGRRKLAYCSIWGKPVGMRPASYRSGP